MPGSARQARAKIGGVQCCIERVQVWDLEEHDATRNAVRNNCLPPTLIFCIGK